MKRPDFETKNIKKIKKKNHAKSNLHIVMVIGYLYSFGSFLHIHSKLNWPHGTNQYALISAIGECICLIICVVLVSIIYYNVSHKRLFIQTNANLIKGIGIVVATGVLLKDTFIINQYPELIQYTTPNHFTTVIGLFIIAIGFVFQEAIKIKEEQDLTI